MEKCYSLLVFIGLNLFPLNKDQVNRIIKCIFNVEVPNKNQKDYLLL